jgi:hypothetical protein
MAKVDLLMELQPKQAEAFLTPATELLYGGAAGGGKSHLMRVAAIIWCLGIPGLQIYLFRRKMPDLIKNHFEGPTSFPNLLAPLVRKKRVRLVMSGTDPRIAFANGSAVHLCHCQHEKDVYNYHGAEIHVLLIDELTLFLESVYRYLRGRVRMVGVTVPQQFAGQFPRILCGSNPGNVGHTWVKGTFVSAAPFGELWRTPKEEGGFLRQYIPARLDDNQKLLEGDPDYETRLQGLGTPALVKAMRDGDWDIVAGGAVDDVWDHDTHVLMPFKIPPDWRIDRTFDWGSSHPFSVGWWAESDGNALPDGRQWPKGTLFRIQEWYGWNGKANQGCKMISEDIAKGIVSREKEFGWTGRVRPGPADSQIFAVIDGKTIAQKMNEAVGIPLFYSCDKGPGSRINGLEIFRGYLAAGLTLLEGLPMENPGMFFFDHCTHAIRTIPVLPRDLRKIDDVDTASEDHPYDEARYRVQTKRGDDSMDVSEAIIASCPTPLTRYSMAAGHVILNQEAGELLSWEEPGPGGTYVMGIMGQQNPIGASTITVIERQTGRQVALWSQKNIPLEQFAEVIGWIGLRYNGAWAVIHREKEGETLIAHVLKRYKRVYAEIPTEARTGRPGSTRMYGFAALRNIDALIGQLATEVRAGGHGIKDADTLRELIGFRKDDEGGTFIDLGFTSERALTRAMAGFVRQQLPAARSVATVQHVVPPGVGWGGRI